MDSRTSFKPDTFLNANSEAYEWLAGRIAGQASRMSEEALLGAIEQAAKFAVTFHTGRFADGAIENLAFRIGSRLDAPQSTQYDNGKDRLPAGKVRRVLHVSNHVKGVGGHTRMIMHWVRDDTSSRHSILLLDQNEIPIPDWLDDVVRDSGGQIFKFPAQTTLLDKAIRMREIARQSADLVVLHHFGWDVVPTVALAVPDMPPVAVLNHADHHFWLGSSVADVVINLRSVSIAHTTQRRCIPYNVVLPVPLTDDEATMSKQQARTALGIKDDEIALLCVGRAEKFRPCGSYDFIGTAGKILSRDPRARLYVVGETAAGIAPYVQTPIHQNMIFVGEVEDPTIYRTAADVYIESFPFGSQTALLEAALAELPIVPAYAPLNPLLVANDDAIVSVLPNPKDEHEYIERATSFMQKPDLRRTQGSKLRELLLVDHIGDGWVRRLDEIYQETDRLTHAPKPIAVVARRADDGDIGLSLWQAMLQPKISTNNAADDRQLAASYLTFAKLRVGDFRGARRKLLGEFWRAPLQRSSWSLLVLTSRAHVGAAIRRLKAYRQTQRVLQG